ncbi:MAG TPA: MoaD/ThiS family protein [Actinoplanes sp.]|nr:MoaD/ThiS family protein [Actinoplanes sp.]
MTGEVRVEVPGEVTQRHVLDAVEQRFPMLLGTMRDRATGRRRALVRFFACEEDLSNDSPDAPLPDRVAAGEEPFLVVGAMAGG